MIHGLPITDIWSLGLIMNRPSFACPSIESDIKIRLRLERIEFISIADIRLRACESESRETEQALRK